MEMVLELGILKIQIKMYTITGYHQYTRLTQYTKYNLTLPDIQVNFKFQFKERHTVMQPITTFQ